MAKRTKKKAIWLFAGGDMQELAAVTIKKLGYKLILTDLNPNCACRQHADKFLELNTQDLSGNLKAVKELKNEYDIKAVFTAGTDCQEIVAVLANYLGLHGVDPKIAHICRQKLETRRILTKIGISQPKFIAVKNLDEARKALKKIGLPAVLKATDNAGSRGFSQIAKKEDLNESSLKNAIDNGTTGCAILEERLEPLDNEIAEQSLETVWYDGKMYWLNWVDRLFRKDFMLFKTLGNIYEGMPWGVELAHINPAVHSYNIKKEVQDMVYKAGLAIGLGKQKGGHILKADIMLTKNGPRILEMTMRLSGGWDSSYSTPQRGANFVEGALRLALGEKLDLDFWQKYFEYKNSNLYCSVLSWIPKNPKDCIGRKFAAGSSFDKEESIKIAYDNLLNKKYISKVK